MGILLDCGVVVIQGLVAEVDAKALHDIFSGFGEVQSVKISQSEEGTSLGYGFVQFKEKGNAEKAIRMGNGSIIKGSKISVAAFVARKDRAGEENACFSQHCKNLYVKGLPKRIEEDSQLLDLFNGFGDILSVKVAKVCGIGYSKRHST